jgi:hypothetical protein
VPVQKVLPDLRDLKVLLAPLGPLDPLDLLDPPARRVNLDQPQKWWS